jgi:peptidyl-prolyl cis-trans isomerase D
MLDFIRKMTKSRFGAAFGVAFVVMLGLAFAGADVTGLRSGSLTGTDKAATVGRTSVTTSDVEKSLRNAVDNQRQQNPTVTLKDVLAQGGLDEVVDGLVERAAMQEWGNKYGFGVSDRLVGSEIAKIAAFQGPDGKFSELAYKQLLAQRGLTDKQVRDDLAKGLLARQLLVPASFGASMPNGVAGRYAAMLKEKRSGSILFIPAQAYAPKAPATDQQIAAFYQGHTGAYLRPERRTLRFAILDGATIQNVPAPTDAEIAARYKLNAAVYAPSESREITQVIVPTEAAAKALMSSGKPLAIAAQAAGLSTSTLKDQTRETLANQASKAVADAVFAAAPGGFAAPAKGPLGWHVVHVDKATRNPGKSVDAARAEIVTALTAEKRQTALADLSAKAEEQFENGTGLADVAKTLGLTITTSDPIQSDGTVFGKPGQKAPEQMTPLLQAAFAMEREGQPQVAEVVRGTSFALFEVSQITQAAAAPLAEIREQVAGDYARDQGAAAARSASDRVLAAMARKSSLADAAKSLGVAVAPIQQVTMTREQLTSMQPKIPAPLALMFAMAKGTSKKLEAPNKAGWLIVSLNEIVPGTLPENDPTIAQAAKELARSVGREYADELRAAMKNEIGVKKYPKSIAALRKQLSGGQ